MGRRTHQRLFFALVITCASFVGACSPRVQVTHDYDPGVDFSRLHSFTWLGIESSRSFSDFDVKRLVAALKAELARKGLEERTKGDAYVAAYLGVRPKAETEWEHSHGMYWRKQNVSSPEGALVVDVVDPVSGNLIWRGRATKMLEEGLSPEQKSRNVARVAEKIFAGFPPR
jgi:hypothetical protein